MEVGCEELHIVKEFAEIKPYLQDCFEQNKVETLFKVRNWREKHHPEFLKDREIYFTRPNELNDPFDICKPFKFDVSVIETEPFFNRLVEQAIEYKGVLPGRDAETVARNKLNEIRQNPSQYFLRAYGDMIKSKRYNDSYGIFSVTTNIDDDQLWAYYGSGQKGFAVGFNPIKLCEELFSSCNLVNYSEEIFISKIIDIGLKEHLDIFFHKYPKWSFEAEYRFIRAFKNDQSRRFHYYNPEIVSEIVLGYRIAEIDEEEIRNVASSKYPNARISRMEFDYSSGKVYHE